jgi:uncharacterized phage protein (TIGR02218 family)
MGRHIPIELADHLAGDATTTTLLIRVDPRTPGFSPFGATYTNRDIRYDDGGGELEYLGYVGMQPSSLLTSGNLSVDNAEVEGLLPEYEFPITERDIQAGVYDFARFYLYLVNYDDLTPGRHIELKRGTLGRMRTKDGLSFWEELRGLSQPLKQTICSRDSLTCRARLGSQPLGTPGADYTEREYCGIDLSVGYWEPGEVLAPSAEVHYGFTTVDPLIVPSGSDVPNYLAPGMVRWTSGANAGTENEIEANGEESISLAFRTKFPIQAGDQFDYRRDCNKHARDADKGCPSHWGPLWIEHIQSEPDIPIADGLVSAVPGGTTTAPVSGAVETAED